jgi:hypothetical protein
MLPKGRPLDPLQRVDQCPTPSITSHVARGGSGEREATAQAPPLYPHRGLGSETSPQGKDRGFKGAKYARFRLRKEVIRDSISCTQKSQTNREPVRDPGHDLRTVLFSALCGNDQRAPAHSVPGPLAAACDGPVGLGPGSRIKK